MKLNYYFYHGFAPICIIVLSLFTTVEAQAIPETADKLYHNRSARDLLVQSDRGELTEVTGVQLRQTAEGLEIVLETEIGQTLVPLILPEGNQLIIDILDATLALPQGDQFQETNPTAGIGEISVTQIDANSIQITITGEQQTPSAEVVPSSKDLILSVSSEAGEQAETDEVIDIVVTAQRTEESLQEVPLSITALDEQQLADGNIQSLRGISDSTPNFSILDASGSRYFLYYSLRGFSNFNFTSRDAVAFYIDDVPYDYGGFLDQNLVDLERVEILRGPQNILYGRSGIAGAVNIITRQPSDRLEFLGDISYGNFDNFQSQASFSAPIVKDKLALRLSGGYSSRDGFIENTAQDNTVDDQSGGNGRAKLLWTPNQDWEITLNGSFEDYRDGGAPFIPLQRDDPFTTDQDVNGFNDFSANTQALKVSYSGAKVRFTSISSRRFSLVDQETDLDYTALDGGSVTNQFDSTIFSQELRLQSPAEAEKLRWLIGGYFESRDFQARDNGFIVGDDAASLFELSPGSSIFRNSDTSETTIATFGQVDYKPIEPLTLTVALRYESNDAELDFLENILTTPDGTVFPNFRVEDIESDSNALLPRFAVEYQITPTVMAYGSITAGYRPAGVNFAADNDSEEVLSFDAERSWNYELGLKSSWFNNRLVFNAAIFQHDINDFQVVIANQFLLPERTDNADARITGAEFELKATPFDGFDILAGLGFVDTDFTEFTNSITGEDFSDNNLLFTPGYTFNVAMQYRAKQGIVGRVELVGSGATFFNEENTLKSEPYIIVNALLGYEFGNNGVYFFANNIFDREYITTAFEDIGFGDFGTFGSPATYGLQVKAKF
ncbi:TonB-dependent receptor domain-containing protein [Hyella patelloides]|nr:TonB-dependent receptor [Hyella patelloides]